MAMRELSVEGPDYLKRVDIAERNTTKLAKAGWDFGQVPGLFGRSAACDVVGKEIVIIFDGSRQTRVGRLYIAGVGQQFHLMGPEHARATFKTDTSGIVDEVNHQFGGNLLEETDALRKFGRAQRADLFNFTNFYQPRDLIFYAALREVGLFPSGFEHMLNQFAAGKLVHNVEFMPPMPSERENAPVLMVASSMHMEFPTRVLEWMDKPLYGGIAKETWHVETVLTTEPTKVSHPYLEMIGEGRLEVGGRRYYMRRFHGKTQKQGVRGPKVPPEGAKKR
ncbi:MAG: hypothetical protein U0163_04865 [Gemmatimonadaceae bacterium]